MLHILRYAGSRLFLFILLSATPLALQAQPKPVDLESRETVLSEERFEKKTLPLVVDPRFQNREWVTKNSNLRKIRWEKRQSPLVIEESQVKKMLEFPTRELEVKEPKEASSSWARSANIKSFDQRKKLDLAPLVRKARITDGYLGKTAYQSMVGKLSMSDINRYQFQKNHSRDPGLPSISAGGQTPPEVKR